jgi:hypothetical protein
MLRLAARQQRSQVLPASILQNKTFIQFVANFHAGETFYLPFSVFD